MVEDGWWRWVVQVDGERLMAQDGWRRMDGGGWMVEDRWMVEGGWWRMYVV